MDRRRLFSPLRTAVSLIALRTYCRPRRHRPHVSASRMYALFFTVVFCLLIQALPAAGVVLTVTAGYEGYVVPGRWAPLEIEVTGVMDGWVQITRLREGLPAVTEEYRCRVEDDTRRLLIPVFAEETGSRFEVRLVEDGKVLGRVGLDLLEKVFPGHLILTVNLPAQHQHTVGPVFSSAHGHEPVLAIPVEFSALPGSALAYDGVSALVVSGDLEVLNPLQVQALRTWLAGGGSLLLFPTQGCVEAEADGRQTDVWSGPAAAGVYGIPTGETEEGWEIRRYGRGRIICAQAQDSGQPVTTVDWQRLLALESYPRPLRLTPGLVFREGEIPRFFGENEGITLVPLMIVLALLFLGGLAVAGIFYKKKTAVALLTYVAVTTLLAVPVGRWLAGNWQRGVIIYTRAVLLPEDTGVLIDTVIRFPESTWKTPVSPWGATLALGETAQGAINREGTGETFWRHDSLQPSFFAKAGDAKHLHLTGLLPPGTRRAGDTHVRGKTGPGQAMKMKAGRKPAGEGAAVQPPGGLLQRDPWLAGLGALFPGERWTVGYGDLPGFTLTLENSRGNLVLWAEPKPLPEGLP